MTMYHLHNRRKRIRGCTCEPSTRASMYASNEAWEADFETLQEMIPEIGQYKGRLAESGETLLAAIRKQEELAQIAANLFVFAGLKSFEDH